MQRRRRDLRLWVLGASWAGLVAAGFAAWGRYEATPGPAAPDPPGGLAPGPVRGVVLYAHPHCACTRGSLGAFADLLRTAPAVTARVVFVVPDEVPPGWERGGFWDEAAELPGVARGLDPGGAEARAAGALTSGCVVATDAGGRVVFRGGYTPGRGRGGDCAGRRALAAALAGREPETRQAPVFGCPLFRPGG